jgi:hypothetical protein
MIIYDDSMKDFISKDKDSRICLSLEKDDITGENLIDIAVYDGDGMEAIYTVKNREELQELMNWLKEVSKEIT